MFINLFRISGFALLLSIPVMFFSCSEEEEGEPAPVAGFVVAPANVVVGDYVTLNNESQNATAYEWSFGNGETSIEENPIVSYSAAGDYTVTLITTGPGGTDQTTMTITVGEPELLFMASGDFIIYSLDIPNNSVSNQITLDGFGIGLAFNRNTNTLFYPDDDQGNIETNALSGGSEQTIVETDTMEVYEIAIDSVNNKMYFTDRNHGIIYEADLDGSNASTLYTEDDGLEVPSAIALDVENGKIYVSDVGLESSDYAADGIWEGNLDGSGITKVITGGGYSVAVDPVNDNLYYNDAFGDEDVKVVPIGDWDNSTSVAGSFGYPRIYGFKIYGTKIYWSDLGPAEGEGTVHRANLDGTSAETLASMLPDPRSLVVYK